MMMVHEQRCAWGGGEQEGVWAKETGLRTPEDPCETRGRRRQGCPGGKGRPAPSPAGGERRPSPRAHAAAAAAALPPAAPRCVQPRDAAGGCREPAPRRRTAPSRAWPRAQGGLHRRCRCHRAGWVVRARYAASVARGPESAPSGLRVRPLAHRFPPHQRVLAHKHTLTSSAQVTGDGRSLLARRPPGGRCSVWRHRLAALGHHVGRRQQQRECPWQGSAVRSGRGAAARRKRPHRCSGRCAARVAAGAGRGRGGHRVCALWHGVCVCVGGGGGPGCGGERESVVSRARGTPPTAPANRPCQPPPPTRLTSSTPTLPHPPRTPGGWVCTPPPRPASVQHGAGSARWSGGLWAGAQAGGSGVCNETKGACLACLNPPPTTHAPAGGWAWDAAHP